MLNLNDIKNLLQHNRLTEFVKINKMSTRDIVDFTNRYTQWAVKLFQHLDPAHAARAFKFLRKKSRKSSSNHFRRKRPQNCSMPCSPMTVRPFCRFFRAMR